MLELYKELIMDHGLNPRNKNIPTEFTHHAKGYNSFCGDTISMYLYLTEEKIIKNILFDGTGCSISIASASIATCILKNKSILNVDEIYKHLQNLLKNTPGKDKIDSYKEINILSNVRYFPSRIKCANLAWNVIKIALNEKKG